MWQLTLTFIRMQSFSKYQSLSIAVLAFALVWYFQCEIWLIVSRRSCICKLKFIKRQINKPKICVLSSKVITKYLYRHLCNKKFFYSFLGLKICLTLCTSQNQKLINMETKISSSAINFKPLFRHSHHLNSLIFYRLWLLHT